MKSITEIDKNFKVETNIQKDSIVFYNALSTPFKIHGVFHKDGKFRRMPEDAAKSVSDGVYALHAHTAGGRIRFMTDSPYVAVQVKLGVAYKMQHFAFTGSIGSDLYVNNTYAGSFIPPYDVTDKYEAVIDLCGREMREITINLPLYSEVTDVYIGLEKHATVSEAPDYKFTRPIVYYGSSVTQGGCASRPGMSYQAILSRSLNADYINLGFSGSARAEDGMAEYIKSLSMSVFVYDYDYNAPNADYLEKTHEKMFLAIREAHPELPILMLSMPRSNLVGEIPRRHAIVKATYENALARGDKNVYHIDGKKLLSLCGDEGTVDMCHPTDLGFFSMAKEIEKILKNILN